VDIIWALLLGLVQGLTEWLPISSSGHLAIAQHFLGEEPPLVFDIMVHFGTTLVLIFYFRKDVMDILRSLVSSNKAPRVVLGRRVAWFLLLGLIPTALIGLVLNYTIIEYTYQSLTIVGTCLILTGLILMLARKAGKRGFKSMKSRDAVLVGIGQGLAILPGLSRSGTTIGLGFIRGLDPETAGRYSFLLAIPATLGAMLLHVKDLFDGGLEIDLPAFIGGTVVAMVVGYLTLALLMKVLKGNGFHHFAKYCVPVGAVVLALGLMGY